MTHVWDDTRRPNSESDSGTNRIAEGQSSVDWSMSKRVQGPGDDERWEDTFVTGWVPLPTAKRIVNINPLKINK